MREAQNVRHAQETATDSERQGDARRVHGRQIAVSGALGGRDVSEVRSEQIAVASELSDRDQARNDDGDSRLSEAQALGLLQSPEGFQHLYGFFD
jgi:hypothetical protein